MGDLTWINRISAKECKFWLASVELAYSAINKPLPSETNKYYDSTQLLQQRLAELERKPCV